MIGSGDWARKQSTEVIIMAITVKFFASLKEQIGRDGASVEAGDGISAADVWAEASGGKPLPANVLVAINMEYSDADGIARDGDEVAFFPPVTGG